MDMEIRKQIAATILEQLGGNKFLAMTGVKNLYCDENGSLGMKLPRCLNGITHLRIELAADDTYTLRFFRVWADKGITELPQESGVYFDQLQEIFTEKTGLRTSL